MLHEELHDPAVGRRLDLIEELEIGFILSGCHIGKDNGYGFIEILQEFLEFIPEVDWLYVTDSFINELIPFILAVNIEWFKET